MHSTIRTPRTVAKAASAVALVGIAVAALTGCSGNSSANAGGISKAKAETAASAAAFGGMSGLEKAADAEGQLNVITLPPTWSNYGKILDAFKKKYPKIKIVSANPNGSSADEISAAKSQKGRNTAPDVFDLGTAVLQQNLSLMAPYKVQNWAQVPDDFKDASGKWIYDYTGLMSIGYDSSKVTTAPTSMKDLLGPAYKGKVSIKGDPTKANEAASAVYLAALENGGSADDVQKGIDYFAQLKKAGNFLSVLPTQTTVNSGETPVVVQWSFNNLAWGPAAGSAGNPNWKVVVPTGTGLGSYYNQAINVGAPHPAAARLWEEFIYSPPAQNLYLAAAAYPAMLKSMQSKSTVDTAVLKTVGQAPSDFVQLNADQATKAGTLLSAKWAAAVR